MRDGDREHKRFYVLGREFKCSTCGWIIPQAASNTDRKRNIVCECPPIIVIVHQAKDSHDTQMEVESLTPMVYDVESQLP